jgi:PAS domain S-box-containing protein
MALKHRRGLFSWTVRRKLHLSVALLALTLVGNTIVLTHSFLKTANAVEEVRLVEQSIGNIFESSLFVRDYIATRDDRAALQWGAVHRRLGAVIAELAEYPTNTDAERQIGRRLRENHAVLGSLFDKLVAGHQSSGWGTDEAEKLIEQSLLMRANVLIADAYKLSAINNAEIAEERQRFVVMLGASVVVSALASLFVLMVNRRVVKSLDTLQQASDQIGAKDFVNPVILAGDDELADLARAMNGMATQIERYTSELRASEERSLLLFKCSPQPMWVFDVASLRFLEVNDRAVEHYGFSRDEFSTMTLRDIRPPEDVPDLLRVVVRPVANGDIGEWRHRKKDGTIIDVAIRAVPITYGTHQARIVLIQDITESNKAAAWAVANLGMAISEEQGHVEVGPLPEVTGNRSELERLFQNLIGNSLKYRSADRPPVVAISAEQDGQNWIVKVTDNGIGIPHDQFERVFGMFQRLHRQGEYEGTGIGLANCKKIVEHHNGRIWVESEPGEGSTFFFTLPAC